MSIEFYGPPASGKTTACKALEAQRVAARVRVRGIADALWHYTRFCARRPRAAWFLVGLYLSHRGFSRARDFYNWVVYRCAKWEKSQRGGAVILDEGLLQNMLSIPRRALTQEEVRRFLSRVPHGDGVVVFALPRDVRRARMRARDERERGGASSRADDALERNFSVSCSVLASLPGVTVVASEEEAVRAAEEAVRGQT